ncbi:MAG TPA: helix-turn-helix domain-containing protein [Solirubrobacterales bacterium]|jgi:DNA-binding transcriptional ArsR family regulator|nr:helix-turn-helix domain-containing protein [Solirubrobacterales bacterium]
MPSLERGKDGDGGEKCASKGVILREPDTSTNTRPEEVADDGDLLKSLRHPLRRQILIAVASRPSTSPRALADELHEPLSNISYHVRALADFGALILVDTEPVRGSVAHFYRFGITTPWALVVLGLDPDVVAAAIAVPEDGEEK